MFTVEKSSPSVYTPPLEDHSPICSNDNEGEMTTHKIVEILLVKQYHIHSLKTQYFHIQQRQEVSEKSAFTPCFDFI